MTPSTEPTKATTNLSRVFLGYVADAVLPMALYYVLHRLGASDVVALAAGIAVALVATIVNTFRHKKLDRFGIIVLLEIALSIALLFLLKDRRLILAKPSFYSALAGLYMIATSLRGRPLTYEPVKNIGAKDDPRRAAAFDAAWNQSAQFRVALRTSAIGWGVAFLADAILRVVIVYTTPIDRAVWLSNVPHIAAIAILIAFSAAMGRVTKRIVDEQVAEAKLR
jgi:hypothetical protein